MPKRHPRPCPNPGAHLRLARPAFQEARAGVRSKQPRSAAGVAAPAGAGLGPAAKRIISLFPAPSRRRLRLPHSGTHACKHLPSITDARTLARSTKQARAQESFWGWR